jgi:hypothetical protein
MFTFNKGLDECFVHRLNAEYELGWWRAIVSVPELFCCDPRQLSERLLEREQPAEAPPVWPKVSWRNAL